ncbi:MAG: ArsA family ATPase [Deltaproteobacteria bacterium]|nr:ArsA family ATPase [Deltaproteobacteria bacterium]MBW2071930.1 ArsA family ATPase [Deltaproteobacteria bacterium]
MRILLYAGKGGVGKTCVAAATGIITATRGLRTLVMSLDPAHSLCDAFDMDLTLMDKNRGQPIAAAENLWLQELDVHEEISKHWGEVHSYLAMLLNTSGIEDVLAEELAVLPGMEELSALLYINRYARDELYDVIILDCAPTAESIRFVSMPTALEWYMKKVFRLERKLASYMRPFARRFADVPLPEDDYFANIERLFNRLQGVDRLLTSDNTTSVRLVTNAEKMVLRETQRAFMFFSLHRLLIDGIIVNRLLPADLDSDFLEAAARSQEQYLKTAESYFRPLPIFKAPQYRSEILGYDQLYEFGRGLYGSQDPTEIYSQQRPYEFVKEDGSSFIKLLLPFVEKREIDLTKIGDELIIKIGNFKKNIVLPRIFVLQEPRSARLEGQHLVVEFGGEHAETPE